MLDRRTLIVSALGALAALAGCDGATRAAEAVPVGAVALALTQRAHAADEAGDAPEAPRVQAPFPRLDDEPEGVSWSSGDTSHGRVFHARRVIESDALKILAKQRKRDLDYGTDEMVGLLERAAKAVFDATGTPMWIGDVGKRDGGDIAWSVSHNAGRDADVAFFYLDASGRPVDAPDLVRLGRDGHSKDRALRLDVKRTWIAIRAMVEDPAASVQYLFISTPLKKLLLDHAKATATSPRTLSRATELLREPGGAAPHDDHLHVRTFCSRRDLAAGCVDAGATYTWTVVAPDVRGERIARATTQLGAGDADARARAARRLALLGARDRVDPIAQRLDDVDASVRGAAARALGELGERRHVAKLAARYALEGDTTVRVAILAGAASLGGSDAGALLAEAIAGDDHAGVVLAELTTRSVERADVPTFTASPGPIWIQPTVSPFEVAAVEGDRPDRAALREAAIELAALVDASEPAPALLSRLEATTDPAARRKIAHALEAVANRSLFDFDREDAAPAEIEAATRRWREVVARLAKQPRDVWIATGFAASGYAVPTLDHEHAWELVRAVAGPSFASRAARRWLARMEGASDPGLDWSVAESCKRWMAHFDEHHRRYRIPRTPDAVKRACWGAPR